MDSTGSICSRHAIPRLDILESGAQLWSDPTATPGHGTDDDDDVDVDDDDIIWGIYHGLLPKPYERASFLYEVQKAEQ